MGIIALLSRETSRPAKDYIKVGIDAEENAQHFYRKLGYKDCGGFTVDIPGYEQPMEMFMSKSL